LTGPVVDLAGILPGPIENELTAKLTALWRSGGTQIAVLTVSSLEGEEIEQASIQVVDAWKLGDAKRDDGVLLFIAPTERRLRIEVGQGREGDLPDAYARRIIDDVITPAFKQGDYPRGVLAGIDAIVERTDPGAYPLYGSSYTSERDPQAGYADSAAPKGFAGWVRVVFIVIMICFLLFTRMGRAILIASLLSGGRGGRSGRSGGGGFRGGGGGFSGGGASGRW
jgi:uncharacterized protein